MGTLRVMELCKKYDMPEPDFKEENGGILGVIYFSHVPQQLGKSHQLDITDRQAKILQFIEEVKASSFQRIKESLQLDISDRTLRNELLLLKDLGLLELVGRGQHARWKRKT
jgi:ATP-dependent DNA helicase RecG